MNVFFAAIATETNSFSSIPTSHKTFASGKMRGAEVFNDKGSREQLAGFFRQLASLVRSLARGVGGDVTPGPFASAAPGAPTIQAVYEQLRDELLNDLRNAGPVDIVLLMLHGAMVAQDTWDCEGDILRRVRAIVGPSTPIGVVLDPHAHLTEEMVANATILSFMKEYPHTDGVDRMKDVWAICLGTLRGDLNPVPAVYDCRMVSFWPTQAQPMRGFVDRMLAREGKDGILSISFVHGFPWGDTPVTGAKMLVYADGDAAAANALARSLGEEIWRIRSETETVVLRLAEGIERMAEKKNGLLVVGDIADNPGGGAPSDSTFLLQAVLDRGIRDVGFAIIYDPQAVEFCHEAGLGTTLDLRIGGKIGPTSGCPVDLTVQVKGLSQRAVQDSIFGEDISFGAAAWVRGLGVDIILSNERVQCLHPTAFSALGLDPKTLRAVVVKSTNHFVAGFGSIASEIIYVDTPGAIRANFAQIPYKVFQSRYWPKDEIL
jgi:microcystin degradation protein MlrC